MRLVNTAVPQSAIAPRSDLAPVLARAPGTGRPSCGQHIIDAVRRDRDRGAAHDGRGAHVLEGDPRAWRPGRTAPTSCGSTTDSSEPSTYEARRLLIQI